MHTGSGQLQRRRRRGQPALGRLRAGRAGEPDHDLHARGRSTAAAALTGAMQTNWRQQVLPIINGTAAPAGCRQPDPASGSQGHQPRALALLQGRLHRRLEGRGRRRRIRRPAAATTPATSPTRAPTTGPPAPTTTPSPSRKGLRELATTPLPYAKHRRRRRLDRRHGRPRPDDGRAQRRPSRATSARRTTPGRPTRATARQNKVWIYNSCEAAACNDPGDEGWDYPFYNGWAGYGIDQPASQARAMPWTAFLYDATGELYWGVDYRLGQAWNTCGAGGTNCLYESGMNGDATLFYPGRACTPGTGAGCIGGTTDIPVESIRLKRIRDGREDYEYLRCSPPNPDTAAPGPQHRAVPARRQPRRGGVLHDLQPGRARQRPHDPRRRDRGALHPRPGPGHPLDQRRLRHRGHRREPNHDLHRHRDRERQRVCRHPGGGRVRRRVRLRAARHVGGDEHD